MTQLSPTGAGGDNRLDGPKGEDQVIREGKPPRRPGNPDTRPLDDPNENKL